MSVSCHFEKLKVPVAVFISALPATRFRRLRSHCYLSPLISGNSPNTILLKRTA